MGEAVAAAVRRLTAAGVPDAGRDARRLVAHVLGVEPGHLTLISREAFDPVAALGAVLERREARQPVSQIVGWREFWGRRFSVTPDVLDPRPETETVVEVALTQPFSSVLDLGVGTGCILLTLMAERPGVGGTGTDLSAAALAVARRNAQALGLVPDLVLSDWFERVEGRWDLIVSNPPYIAEAEMPNLAPELAHEPRLSLTPGGDGLEAYRRIIADADRHLTRGGRIVLEVGHEQGGVVAALLERAGFADVAVARDLDDRERVVSAIRCTSS